MDSARPDCRKNDPLTSLRPITPAVPIGWTFRPGDKVMQVENDYDKEVYNGDLGVVSRIDMEEGPQRRLRRPQRKLRLWRARRTGTARRTPSRAMPATSAWNCTPAVAFASG
jgi:ATP-dependent exoDNAse (exonuclease V) alpha subunit